MSKKYYVSNIDSCYYVYRPNGDILTRAATVDNAKYICAELNQLLHRIPTPESAPKYDPCRLFRKGDKVRVVEYKGRCMKPYTLIVGDILSVADDEANDDTFIVICKKNNTNYYLDPAYLELVTPVEGYFQVEGDEDEQEFYVVNGSRFVASYGYGPDDFYKKEEAKAAAQAECARLNAEHRKEQK